MADSLAVPWAFSALFNQRAVAAEAVGRTVFVFPGQGLRWAEMAREMLNSAPAFAEEMRRCDTALREHFEWSLLDVIRDGVGSSDGDRINVQQSGSFAVMVSLAAHWRELGIHPDAVLGHSHGETAAAYVAGGLALRDAALVVAQRSKVISATAGTGGTVAIAWPVDRVLEFVERWGTSVFVAAHNGPSSTVVTGAPAAIDEVTVELERADVSAERIPVEFALACHQIEEARPALRESLAELQPHTGDVVFISSVTGAALDTSILDGDYWFANLRQPVLFEQAVRWSHEHAYHTFIEASAEPVLISGIRELLSDNNACVRAESR